MEIILIVKEDAVTESVPYLWAARQLNRSVQ